MSDCWLEDSTHPKGPAIGQLNQDFLRPAANSESVTKFQPALRVIHAALQYQHTNFVFQ
jgi:hypothetical protein